MICKMGDDADLRGLPLSSIPLKTQKLLSCLLNTPKIIPSDGPDKLPRDWRGLASLVNITSEQASYIKQFKDKTSKVLEIWKQQDGATVGQLFDFLKHIDRFDVYEDISIDLKEEHRKWEASGSKQRLSREEPTSQNGDYMKAVTYDDRPDYEEQYHAFVLFAEEDRAFVDELQQRLGAEGFKICTVDSLIPGYPNKYAPISELISKRCQRIILIYSPEFLDSPANTFYTGHAQAAGIETRQRLIIPIMYRECQLPKHLAYYHNLYYKSEGRAMYDFWQKLKHSLNQNITVATPTQSRMNTTAPMITNEQLPSSDIFKDFDERQLFLNLPPIYNSPSLSCLDSLTAQTITDDSRSISSLSQISNSTEVKKKKKNPFSRMFRPILGKKKEKKAIPVAN